jgi:hypothetical protein
MNQDTLDKLRLDRRLALRRGWISQEDLDRALEALPDVADKIAPAEAEEAPAEEPATAEDRPV